jgi:hypothetical protein
VTDGQQSRDFDRITDRLTRLETQRRADMREVERLTAEVHGLRKTADKIVWGIIALLAGLLTNLVINLIQGNGM